MQTTNLLRTKRLAKGLTMSDLARKLDVTPQLVSLWENGQCWPGPKLMPKLAKVFGQDPEAFVSEVEAVRRPQVAA